MEHRKNSITEKDAPHDAQILFRTTSDRKRRLNLFLASRGQTIQWFMNKLLERALPVQKEQN